MVGQPPEKDLAPGVEAFAACLWNDPKNACSHCRSDLLRQCCRAVGDRLGNDLGEAIPISGRSV